MGQLLMQRNAEDSDVESSFCKAITISQAQCAKSMELRATVSLSRFLQKHGKKEEARKLLSKIYVCFTEGFDTADLIEAKAFLKELT
jgi:predicted ATPase